MLVSMTGFATTTIEVTFKKGGAPTPLVIELKSLNSRFFEFSARLPSSLSILETDLLGVIKEQLIRGRVFLVVHLGVGQEPLSTIMPSTEAAHAYISALQKIAKENKLPGTLTINDLIHLPNIFIESKEIITPVIQKKILAAARAAADKLMQVRTNEGSALERDIVARLALCGKGIEKISKVHAELMKEQAKLVKEVQALITDGDEVSRARLTELSIMLNKMDVTEEITRFRSHLAHVKDLLRDNVLEKGKRLDFLIQEFLREINTISAKCSNFEISSIAVDIKVELEKIREQVQNVL